MPDRVFHSRHQTFRIIMDALVVILLVVAVFQQNQNRDLGNQIKNTQANFIKEQRRVNLRFAQVLIRGCVSANDARQSLKNLLVSAEAVGQMNPNSTPEQKRQSKEFLDAQIANIHFTDCSKYSDVASN